MNTWPGNRRRALTQDQHEVWNRAHYPGTRQLCDRCMSPTERCEEDSILSADGDVLCGQCADELDCWEADT